MTMNDRAQFEAAISELANATQVLAVWVTQVQRSLGIAADDVVKLDAATDRVVKAVQGLQPRAE
jgi:hypothetical protein